jgi:histidinol-phosphate aminotransferase
MTQKPTPKAFVTSLPAYHVAEAADYHHNTIRLSFNEGAFGPSPKAVAAYQAALPTLHRYPEMSYAALRTALAATYEIEADRIICGAGSDELLILLARAYAGPGDEIIFSQYGFAMYAVATKAVGAECVIIPEQNFTLDVDALLAAVTPRTRVVFIANPNNPTGYYADRDTIRRLHDGLPKAVLLVLDAAYAEYMTAEDYEDGLDLASSEPNVIVTRTFSKIHALGGLRVGWGYGAHHIIDALNRLRNPFNIANPSVLAAIASLGDTAFQRFSRDHNTQWRTWLAEQLRQLDGFTPLPSATNFILVQVGSVERAKHILAALRDSAIQVRSMNGYGLPDYIRITIGRDEEMRKIVAALQSFCAREAA